MDSSEVISQLEKRIPQSIDISETVPHPEEIGPAEILFERTDQEVKQLNLDAGQEASAGLWMIFEKLKNVIPSGKLFLEEMNGYADPTPGRTKLQVHDLSVRLNDYIWSLRVDAIQNAVVLPDVVAEFEEPIAVRQRPNCIQWQVNPKTGECAKAMRALLVGAGKEATHATQDWELFTLWYFVCVENEATASSGDPTAVFEKIQKMEASKNPCRLTCREGKYAGQKARTWGFQQPADLTRKIEDFAIHRLGLKSNSDIGDLYKAGKLLSRLGIGEQESPGPL